MTDVDEETIADPAIDGDAAADAAPPAEAAPAPIVQAPVTFEEMALWLFDRIETREGVMNAFYPVGSPQRVACEREIKVARKIFDGVVFMRDHEPQLRAFLTQINDKLRKSAR